MTERRSHKRKSELLLKNILLIPRLTIPAGWSTVLEGERFTFAFHGGKPGNLHHDPYLMRRKFLAIATLAQGLSFFKKYGPFDVRWKGEFPPAGAAGEARQLPFEELLREQQFYRKVLLDPKYWQTMNRGGIEAFMESAHLNFLRSPAITIEFGKPPFLLMESVCVKQAMYTTIYLDWIQRLKSVKCAECGAIVRQENQHFQRFCTIRCGNIHRKKQWNKTHGVAATKGTR